MSTEPREYRSSFEEILRNRLGVLVLQPIREKLEASLQASQVNALVENAIPFQVAVDNTRLGDQLNTDRILCQILGTTITSTALLEETIGVQNSFVNSVTSQAAYVDRGPDGVVRLVMRIGASDEAEHYATAVGMETELSGEDLLIKYTIPSLDDYLDNISTFIVNYYFIMSRFPACQSLRVHFPDFLQ